MNLLYSSGGDYRIYKTSSAYWNNNDYVDVKDVFKILPQSGVNTSFTSIQQKRKYFIFLLIPGTNN